MVTTQTSFIDFLGDGSNATFTFPFFSLSSNYIHGRVGVVEVNGKCTLNADGVGGTFTLFIVPQRGAKVRIFRQTPMVQEAAFPYGSELPAASFGAALDRLTCIVQESVNLTNETDAIARQCIFLKQGPKGDKGDDGLPAGVYTSVVFFAGEDQPQTPTDTTGPVPQGWSDAPVPNVQNWTCRGIIGPTGAVIGAWSVPVKWNAAAGPWRSFVFKLSATRPAKPTSTAPVPTAEGWVAVRTQPETETLKWWMTSSDIVANLALAWDEPDRLTGEKGQDGEGAVWKDEIYALGTDAAPPARPTGYDPVHQAGSIWFDEPPVPTGNQRVFLSQLWRNADDTPVVVPPVWAVPVPMSGAQGTKGDFYSEVFRASEEQPPTPTGSGPIPAGWVDYIDRLKDDDGNVLRWWRSGNLCNGETRAAIDPAKWAVPVPASAQDGDNLFTIYKASKLPPAPLAPSVFPDSPEFVASGWSYTPPTLTGEEIAWMCKGVFDMPNHAVIKPWTSPSRVSGESGADGAVTISLFKVFNPETDGTLSINAPTGFGDSWTDSANHWASQGWYRAINQIQSGGIIYETVGVLNAYGTGFFGEGMDWVTPFRITGESGAKGDAGSDGLSTITAYKVATEAPELPVGNDMKGWSVQMPDLIPTGSLLWATSRQLRGSAEASPWSGPGRLSGAVGERGPSGSGISTALQGRFDAAVEGASADTTFANGLLRDCRYNLTGGVVNLIVNVGRAKRWAGDGAFQNALAIVDVSALPKYLWPEIPPEQRIPDDATFAFFGVAPAFAIAGRNIAGEQANTGEFVLGVNAGGTKLAFYYNGDTEKASFGKWNTFNARFSIALSVSYNITLNPDKDTSPVIQSLSKAETVFGAGLDNYLFVLASGPAPLSYQWASSADGEAWADIEGATADILSAETIGELSYPRYFRCTVSNTTGDAVTRSIHVTVEVPA